TRRKVGTADQSLLWDAEGNLESVTEAGKTTSFVYDAEGDRLIRKTPTDATLYVDDMELRFDFAKDVVEQTRYYTVNDQPIAVRTPDNQVYFLASDHQGTAQAAVNAGNGDLAVRRSTPFGEDRGTAPPWWPGQRGFVGGTKDATTGLVHLGAREYDPKNGRFLSVDPIIDDVDPQQLNAYAYANNSPVTMTDPDGQWVWVVVGIGVRLGARYLAKRAAQRALRREAIRRAREAARRRALEEARKKAREEARKRALEAARKRAQEAARKRAAETARKRAAAEARRRAAEAARRAREAAARRRAAAAARREARKAAREAAAKRRMAQAAQRRNHRAGRIPRGVQQARSRPARRPTSHRSTQRQAPPRANRQPARPRPSQVYRNDGTAQPTQSYTVYGNGRMYPQGRPPSSLPRNRIGQAENIFKKDKVELTNNTRRGATMELSSRSPKIIDDMVDFLDFWLGGMG
ncbi:RHS repeat domain-containing protein, partial [Nonomuraea purpurea]